MCDVNIQLQVCMQVLNPDDTINCVLDPKRKLALPLPGSYAESQDGECQRSRRMDRVGGVFARRDQDRVRM